MNDKGRRKKEETWKETLRSANPTSPIIRSKSNQVRISPYRIRIVGIVGIVGDIRTGPSSSQVYPSRVPTPQPLDPLCFPFLFSLLWSAVFQLSIDPRPSFFFSFRCSLFTFHCCGLPRCSLPRIRARVLLSSSELTTPKSTLYRRDTQPPVRVYSNIRRQGGRRLVGRSTGTTGI